MPKKETSELNIPNHVAIIPDGNRRWAKEKGFPAIEGHRKGADITYDLIKKARDMGIHTLSFWGFSTENWNRTEAEVDNLMKIFENMIDKHRKESEKENARFIHIGRKERFPESLRKKLIEIEEETKNNTKHVLNMCLDYGGQDEILRAIQKIIKDIQEGKISPEEISKETGKYKGKYPLYKFKDYLDTQDQPYPYPDLVIRTSGEKRLSGFMPWQITYSELYFPNIHFPDFGPKEFEKAIKEYSNRNRTFGGN